jgi:putative radical SAM enzyme (TIGR03279 family)
VKEVKSLSKIKIKTIEQNSIAQEAGIEVGDKLLLVNDNEIKDVFDYRFLIYNSEISLLIQKSDGEKIEIEIEKDEYEDLGIEFEDGLLDDCKSCTNKCIFCFIDQLPKGMRETVYFKDDDTRLSFLTGNYVTLTNVKHEEIERIINYRMSPINISVHTTNPELRRYMLGNRLAGDILEKIERLTECGIIVNCQIVLCKGINDNEELDRTLNDLSTFFPLLESISVVPVGITKFREGLKTLNPFDKESAQKVLEQLKMHQENFALRYGKSMVYAADELYLLSKTPVPEYKHYQDFPQIENGVGMITLLQKEFDNTFRKLKKQNIQKDYNFSTRKVTIATGMSAYTYIKRLTKRLNKSFGVVAEVIGVSNNFFGENVTVTGLLTGQDIAETLYGKVIGDEVLICRNMLRSGETTFLDDWTVEKLSKHLGKTVIVVDNNGKDFIMKVLGIFI